MRLKRRLRRLLRSALVNSPLSLVASDQFFSDAFSVRILYVDHEFQRRDRRLRRAVRDHAAPDPEKLHYFCMSFTHGSSGSTTWASAYMGWPDRDITVERIKYVKASLGLDPGAVLVSCSYIGHMTREKMTGTSIPKGEQ